MKKILALLFVLLADPALAQSVQQSGTITPGHASRWIANGIIGDGGTAADSLLTSLGVTNNSTAAFCVASGRASAAGRQQLCLGAPLGAPAQISLQNYGTAVAQSLVFNINGTSVTLPSGGGVFLTGTAPFTIGHTACFSTTGGLMVDCGASFGIPGGSTGQLQINSSGSFGGITLGGDCTFTSPNITCTKSNNVAFGSGAFVTAYSLPTASTSVLGGVKVDGSTITIAGGVISALGNGRYVSNGGSVQVGPYQTSGSCSANFGPTGGQTALEYVSIGNYFRIRQNGTVNKVKMYLPAITGITGFYVKIWRAEGTKYDLVGTSANIVSSLAIGSNAITISIPNVQYGDYIGLRAEYSGGASVQNFCATAGATGTYSVLNATPSATQYDWLAQTATSGTAVIEEVFMTAPIFVSIGDSTTGGSNQAASFAQTTAKNNINTAYPYVLGNQFNYTNQNVGVSNNNTTAQSARFATDVTAKNPNFVVILGGVVDILAGVPNITIVANITSMLNAALAAGIYPVVVGVLPFRDAAGATNAMLQQRDLLNASLRALVIAPPYSGAYVNPDPRLGQYYVGGDANNLWSLQMTDDGLHPTPSGYVQLSDAIYNTLTAAVVDAALAPGSLNVNSTYSYNFGGVQMMWAQPSLFSSYLGLNAGVSQATLLTANTGNYNTIYGYSAFAANTTGSQNTALGALTMVTNTTGGSNTAVGASALYHNTTGGSNVGVGLQALYQNTTGGDNVAMGSGPLNVNTTGGQNTAIGSGALGANISSSGSTAVGYSAMAADTAATGTAVGAFALATNTSGARNTALGYSALQLNVTGADNFAAGYTALQRILGSQNTALGSTAGALATSGSNNTLLGYNAGAEITTGSANTVVGANNGSAGITTGSNNSILGGGLTGLSAALDSNIILADGAGNIRARYNAGWGLSAAGTSPVLTSCGTSPAILGSDLSGTVTMGTGGPTGCVITFAAAKGLAPHCAVTWRATPLASQSYTISTTALTLTQTGTSSNVVDYVCVGL